MSSDAYYILPLEIGGTIGGSPTAGDVLYIGAGGVLAQTATPSVNGLTLPAATVTSTNSGGVDFFTVNGTHSGDELAFQLAPAGTPGTFGCQFTLGSDGAGALPQLFLAAYPGAQQLVIAQQPGSSTAYPINFRVGGVGSAWYNAPLQLQVGSGGCGLALQSLADSAAPNNWLYNSSTASALAYKDSSGTVHNLIDTADGTVTTVSATVPSGFSVAVTNPTTTPAIAITTALSGVLKGTGSGIAAATAGTDYVVPSGSITGTAANVTGTVAVANGGTGATTLAGLVKGNGTSAFTAAVAGTDYVVPSGSITGTAANVTGTVAVANGGTGATSLTGLVKGNGTSAFTAATAGTDYLAPNGSGAALTGIAVSQVSGAAPLASPTFTGTVTVPTLDVTDGDNVALGTTTGTKIATATTQKLAFYGATPVVQPTGDLLTAVSNLGLVGSPTISESDVTGLSSSLSALAPLASPTFTGTPAAPTATAGTNTTQLATTAFVATATAGLAPTASPTFTGTAAFADLKVGSTSAGSGYPATITSGSTGQLLLMNGDGSSGTFEATGGVAWVNTFNASNNRQVSFYASEQVGNSADYGFRYILGFPIPLIDGINGTGTTGGNVAFNCNLGVGHGTSNVQADIAAQLHVLNQTAGSPAAIVQAASGQTGDLLQPRNSSGTAFTSGIDANGYVRMITGSGAPTSSPADGALYLDTTNKVLYGRCGGAWATL